MARFLWFVALLWCTTATSMGQGVPPSQAESGQSPAAAPLKLIPRSHAEREARFRAIHHIILNVRAVDDFQMPVAGLRAQDFVLLDNGQPQVLTSFREVNGNQRIIPPQVILILDAVNGTSRSVAYEIKEIRKYLGSNQGRLIYPTSIAILKPSGFKASRTSIDGSVLLQESRTLFKDIHPFECENSLDASVIPFGGGTKSVGPSGEAVDLDCLTNRFTLSFTALYDLATEQENAPGRVIVVWIGPGWPLLTGPGFRPDTPEIKANYFDHIVQLSRTLREAQVTVDAVYSTDMFGKPEPQGVHEKSFAEGPLTEKQTTASDLALQAIATQSGGRILESKSIAAQIARCVADEQTYYALSFESIPSSKPDEYHSLQVKVNKSGVKVFTNTLYYGEP